MPAGTLLLPGGPATKPGTSYLYVAGAPVERHSPLDLQPIRWSDAAGGAVGTLSFVIEDQTYKSRLLVPGGADVRVVVDGTTVWGGTLVRRRMSRAPRGRIFECDAVSYEAWLDWRIVPRWASRTNVGGVVRRLTTDRQMVKDIIERRGAPLRATNATVDETNDAMDVVRATDLTVRGVLELIADEAQEGGTVAPRHFHVDEQMRLHWYAGLVGEAAPWRITDHSYIKDTLAETGLLGYWTLREGSGDTFYDASASAAHLARPTMSVGATASPVGTEQSYKTARWEDDDRAYTTTVVPLRAGDSFTFECWLKVRSFAADGIVMTTTGSTDTGPQIQVMTDGDVRLYKRSTGVDFITTTQPLDGEWHHLVVAHGVGSTAVYVDGVSQAGTLTSQAFTNLYDTWQLGASAAAVNADLCHVAWYDGEQSAAWALARYRLGRSVNPEGFSLDYDWSEVVHHVFVKGANRAGSGWVVNTGSDFERGAVTAYMERPRADTAAERNRAGKAFLRRHQVVTGGAFQTLATGAWRAGQTLYVTDAAAGLTAEAYQVTSVNAEIPPGSVPIYDIEFGAIRRSLLRMLPPRRRRRR